MLSRRAWHELPETLTRVATDVDDQRTDLGMFLFLADLRTLRDGQGEVVHLGGAHPFAVGGPFVTAELMELGANGGGHPGFQQVLEAQTHDLW